MDFGQLLGPHYCSSNSKRDFPPLFLPGLSRKERRFATNQMESLEVAVTLLSYFFFNAVNGSLSLLAAFVNLIGLTFEALQLNPQGLNIAVIFHGVFCLLIGYLRYRSTFLPEILRALIAFADLSWLTYLSLPLSHYLSPTILPAASIGIPVAPGDGANVQRWQEQAGAAGASIRT